MRCEKKTEKIPIGATNRNLSPKSFKKLQYLHEQNQEITCMMVDESEQHQMW
jgi:hypothetical protein